MSENMTDLTRKYEELIDMADKIQSRETLSPASLQLLVNATLKIGQIPVKK